MSEHLPITVALAGFEDLLTRGLRSLVDEDEHLTLVASDLPVDDLERRVAELAPRVCILNLGALRSAADIRRIHAASPAVRLVVLSNRPSPAETSQLLALGATACLAKDVQARDIRNAIHLASRGLQVLPQIEGEGRDMGPELLTPREADVLQHLRLGRSNPEIAHELCVSVETVRTHRRNIYRKLGVRTRRELTALVAS